MTTKRLVIDIPEEQHRAIKARALLRNISMKRYVLEKLNNSKDKDLTNDLTEALKEVSEYKKGKKELNSARDFFNNVSA